MCCQNNKDCSLIQTLEEIEFEKSIWSAAVNGDFEKIKSFSKMKVNQSDKYGYTALHYAAHNGHLDICRYLIDNFANVNAVTKSNLSTPLHRASYKGNIDIIKFLIEKGANFMLKDADGKTSLDKAVENNQIDAANTLTSFLK